MSGYACPPADPGLRPGNARIYPLVATVVFPVWVIVGLVLFIKFRPTSVFLRKRPLSFIFIGAFGAVASWVFVPLADAVGIEQFPCWFSGLLLYLAPAAIMSPLVLKDARYLGDVAAIRLGKDLARARARTSRQSAASINVDVDDFDIVDAEGSWKNFLSHLRVAVFGMKKTEIDRLRNVQFTRSRSFVVFWMSMICMPFALSFAVRLATDMRWNRGCFGCSVSRDDAIISLVWYLSGCSVGTFVHRNRVSSRDALLITRETQVCWRVGFLAALGMLLVLIDPAGVFNPQGIFNWLEIMLLTPMTILHVQTYHQVFKARSMMHKLLQKADIDREERFRDIMKNKELKHAFRSHLDNELSSEIYLFMDACDSFRLVTEKEARLMRAEKMVDSFLDRRSQFEINVSGKVRDRLMESWKESTVSGVVPPDIFDEAYDEVKRHLLNDSFLRFLTTKEDVIKAAIKGPSMRTPKSNHQSTPKNNATPRSTPTASQLSVRFSGGFEEHPTSSFPFGTDDDAESQSTTGKKDSG